MCLEQNGHLTNNQRPQKHYSHLIEPKNFDQELILLKKLVFYSKKQQKMVKNGQKRQILSRLELNGYLTNNQRPQKD